MMAIIRINFNSSAIYLVVCEITPVQEQIIMLFKIDGISYIIGINV